MPAKKFEQKPVVDIKEYKGEGIARKVGDLDEDAWSFGAPPPHELYQLKVFLARDGMTVQEAEGDDTNLFFVANLECRIVSDNVDYDGMPVFFRVTTRPYRGHTLSTMEHVLVKMGFKTSLQKRETVTDKLIAEMLLAAIKKEPLIWAEVDWRGSYSWINAKGVTVWENPLRTFTDFQLVYEKESGKPMRLSQQRIMGVDKQPHDIRAQLTVIKVYGKDDKDLPKVGSIAAKDLEITKVQVMQDKAKSGKTNGPAVVMASPTVAPILPVQQSLHTTDEDLDLLMEQ